MASGPTICVLGAGFAGTYLTAQLLDQGFKGRIVLCDKRSSFDREQRWCTWAEIPRLLQPLCRHHWHTWCIAGATQHSSRYSYQEIFAPEYFHHFHSQFEHDSRVEFFRGVSATALRSGPETVQVSIGRDRVISANYVFDATGAPPGTQNSGPKLEQTFYGLTVEANRPAFFPSEVTLMNFLPRPGGGLRFAYVLPYSERSALVEITDMAADHTPTSILAGALDDYLEHEWPGVSFSSGCAESGSIRMSLADFESNHHHRIIPLGTSGGAIRASSGYGIHRTWEAADHLANQILSGKNLERVAFSRKYRVLDAIFLGVLMHNPRMAPALFKSIATNVSGETFARFMTDRGSLWDDIKVVLALPKLPFIVEAISQLCARLPQALSLSKPRHVRPVAHSHSLARRFRAQSVWSPLF